jgi:aminoglycoside 2''-phosphotransferase
LKTQNLLTPSIEACLALLAELFPQVLPGNPDEITPINEGWDSLVLDIADQYIFRFPRLPEIVAQHRKEALLLPHLARRLSFAVPSFEFASLSDPDLSRCFVGYRKIPGVALSADLLASPQIISQLAWFLSELHRFPPKEAARPGVPQPSPQQWRQNYIDFYAWAQGEAFPMLDSATRQRMAGVWEGYLSEEAHFRFQPVLVHGDLGGEHILCDPLTHTLNGVIDWEDAAFGDPAYDFAGLLSLGGQACLRQILASYEGVAEATFIDRAAFYLEIVPFHQIHYGLLIGDKNHLRQALSALTEAAYCRPNA